MTCFYCSGDIDTRDRDTLRRVSGWAPLRTIRRLDLAAFDRRELGQYTCGDCARDRKLGIDRKQGTLI